VSFDATSSNCMPPPLKHSHMWPLTLKTFSAIPTHKMNISGQVLSKSLSTIYIVTASREIILCVNGCLTTWPYDNSRVQQRSVETAWFAAPSAVPIPISVPNYTMSIPIFTMFRWDKWKSGFSFQTQTSRLY